MAATVFCSRADLDFVRQGAPDANLVQIPNGVDCNLFSPRRPGEEQTADIFFSGNFLYSPNRDAVRFFLKAIFPLVRQAIPDATFTVVGNGAAKFMAGKRARIPGVRVFDFVPDLRAHLARASVAVAPMRVGAGVSNKLLEAFAVGTPTVSTRMASGDLPVRDGEHLFLADGESLFAERVILLLKSPDRRRSMAARAQTLVKNTFDWEIVSRSMEDVLYGAALSPAQAWARSTTTQPTASAAAMAAAVRCGQTELSSPGTRRVADMQAFVLAGGPGTRLRPLSTPAPKRWRKLAESRFLLSSAISPECRTAAHGAVRGYRHEQIRDWAGDGKTWASTSAIRSKPSRLEPAEPWPASKFLRREHFRRDQRRLACGNGLRRDAQEPTSPPAHRRR